MLRACPRVQTRASCRPIPYTLSPVLMQAELVRLEAEQYPPPPPRTAAPQLTSTTGPSSTAKSRGTSTSGAQARQGAVPAAAAPPAGPPAQVTWIKRGAVDLRRLLGSSEPPAGADGPGSAAPPASGFLVVAWVNMGSGPAGGEAAGGWHEVKQKGLVWAARGLCLCHWVQVISGVWLCVCTQHADTRIYPVIPCISVFLLWPPAHRLLVLMSCPCPAAQQLISGLPGTVGATGVRVAVADASCSAANEGLAGALKVTQLPLLHVYQGMKVGSVCFGGGGREVWGRGAAAAVFRDVRGSSHGAVF
jgi:hypothetical protein